MENLRNTANNEKYEDTEDVVIKLPVNATFADLFKEIEDLDDETKEQLYLEEELMDNFGEEIALAFAEFEFETDIAAKTVVLDFFAQAGYSKEDVGIYLPIKFK